MAIESAAFLRRFARTECLLLLLIVLLCAIAAAQTTVLPTVTSSSAVGVVHGQWGQIYDVAVGQKGDVLFLDNEKGALYQLMADGITVSSISAPGAVLSTWDSPGMALDSNDVLYVSEVWNGHGFYRVPYDSASGTWKLTAQNSWGSSLGIQPEGVVTDSSNNVIFSQETDESIKKLTVNADGTAGTLTVLVSGLKARAMKLAVDSGGNVYFIEDPWVSDRTTVGHGIYMIPAGTSGIVGTGKGDAEAQLSRIDPGTGISVGTLGDFKGMRFDAAGNLYISSQNDTSGGKYDMVLMVPPVQKGKGTFNWAGASMVAPVSATAAIGIDPRGFLWIPTGTGGWNSEANTLNFVKLALGSDDVGSSAVGAQSTTPHNVYFSFSKATTPASFAYSEVSGTTDFATVTGGGTCAAGTAYTAYSQCSVQVALNSQIVGGVSGQLLMLDSKSNVLGSAYVHGVGQGSGLSVLLPAVPAQIGSGLTSQAQVAADAYGNAYVANGTQVLKYAKGATASTAGVSVGSGLTAPTGVAVDGAGNVYIGDSGNVIMVPASNLSSAGTVIQTGLGSGINLAVDGAGIVYAADPNNSRIVRVANQGAAFTLTGVTVTAGSGFDKPSAIAVDGSGNLFVADGTSLYEVLALGGQTEITKQLNSVTGLAVDASGSVYVAEAAGLVRIPLLDNVLSVNDELPLGAFSSPAGVALDSAGDVFVSNAAASPYLNTLSINGQVQFGTVDPSSPVTLDATLFNIGNLSLNLTGYNTGSSPDFLVATTGSCAVGTPVATGATCQLPLTMSPAGDSGFLTTTLSILSDAANASPVTIALSGTAKTLAATNTAMTISPNTGLSYPASVTATVTVTPVVAGSGSPTGSVTISIDSVAVTSADLVNGAVTIPLNNLGGGTHVVVAAYSGDTTFGRSSDTSNLPVSKAVSTASVSTPDTYVKFGTSYSLTVKVTSTAGTPTGKVRFMEGSALADPLQPSSTLDSDGNATFNTSNLTINSGLGSTHTITAVYDGDANFAAVTAASVTFQLVKPSVLITTPSALSVSAGTPGSVILTMKSIVGFANKLVNVACDNTTVPSYSECTFDTPQVNVVADGQVNVTLTLSTNVPVNVARDSSRRAPWMFTGVFALGVVGLFAGRKTRFNRRSIATVCLLLLVVGAFAGMTACGNGGYSKVPPAPHVTTPSGTYNVGIILTRNDTQAVVSLPFTFSVTVK